MSSTQLNIVVDTRPLVRQIQDLAWLLQYVPKRRARVFYRKLLTLFARGDFAQFLGDERLAARGAGDCVLRLRVRGLDELIAAAFRAAKLRSNSNLGHKRSPGVDEDGVGASDSTCGGNGVGNESSLVHVASHRTRAAQP